MEESKNDVIKVVSLVQKWQKFSQAYPVLLNHIRCILTLYRLNKLPHTLYLKSPISILGMPGCMI